MTPHRPPRDDDDALTLALFRRSVIAELVERDDFEAGEITRLVREISRRTHYEPGRGLRQVKTRTIWSWLAKYRKDGLAGLMPQKRKDWGIPRVLDPQTIERAVALRKEQPDRWTSILLDMLQREGRFEVRVPHRSTLDRHLRMNRASRRQLATLGGRRHIKMKFEEFGALWVGDGHVGPLVRGPNGQAVRAVLCGFIDHCTRWPVADRYYLVEDFDAIRHCLLLALLTWGPHKGGKIYVDNGGAFRARQLAWALDALGVHLVHSRAYYSEGRGVIERWWQVAGAFENEVAVRDELLDLHELNHLWEAWRTLRYCEVVHSELRRTPAQAVAEVRKNPIDPVVMRELFLVREKRRVNKKDGCVPVLGRRFLCDSHLRGETVQVRFDPSDLSSVFVHKKDPEHRRLQRAFPQPLNAPPEPHLTEPDQVVAQSIDYLGMLRAEIDRRLVAQARPLAYADLPADESFGLDEFVQVVANLADMKLRAPERFEVVSFWEQYGPLPERLVRVAVEHAVRLQGCGRHAQVYLHAIRTLVLGHWRNSEEEP